MIFFSTLYMIVILKNSRLQGEDRLKLCFKLEFFSFTQSIEASMLYERKSKQIISEERKEKRVAYSQFLLQYLNSLVAKIYGFSYFIQGFEFQFDLIY